MIKAFNTPTLAQIILHLIKLIADEQGNNSLCDDGAYRMWLEGL